MQSLNILVIMRIFTLGVIVSGVNTEKERFVEPEIRTGNDLFQSTLLIDYESDFQPHLLTKLRNNDQSICRKQSDGSFKCPEIREEKVILAIQRDFDSLPHFDTEQYNTDNWARNYPALKIYSSGMI